MDVEFLFTTIMKGTVFLGLKIYCRPLNTSTTQQIENIMRKFHFWFWKFNYGIVPEDYWDYKLMYFLIKMKNQLTNCYY